MTYQRTPTCNTLLFFIYKTRDCNQGSYLEDLGTLKDPTILVDTRLLPREPPDSLLPTSGLSDDTVFLICNQYKVNIINKNLYWVL